MSSSSRTCLCAHQTRRTRRLLQHINSLVVGIMLFSSAHCCALKSSSRSASSRNSKILSGGGGWRMLLSTRTTNGSLCAAAFNPPVLVNVGHQAMSRRPQITSAAIPAPSLLIPANQRVRLGGVTLFASTTATRSSSSSSSGKNGTATTAAAAAAVVLQQTETTTTTTTWPTSGTKIRKTQLITDLKQYRIQQSSPLGKPPYSIFTNAVMDEIYTRLPTTLEELLEIKGIGPKKLDMFGDDILTIVQQYTDANGNPRRSSGNTEVFEESAAATTAVSLIEVSSLTAEQRHAANLVLSTERPNVFVSGRAGTGKSYLLQYVVQELQRGRRVKPVTVTAATSTTTPMVTIGSAVKVGVCAPTGVAAILVGGSTLHSYFGIGLGTGSMSKLIQKVKSNVEVQKRIDETDVLIIDECSMLSSHLLETLNIVVRQVRQDGKYTHEPFGGMQIICVGDFFQLPPIPDRYHDYNDDDRDSKNKRPFCFDSPVWQELGLTNNMLELQEVQRQDNRGDFVELLNKVRIGQIDQVDIAHLNAKCVIDNVNHPLPSDGILPTRLYSHNKDVDAENEARLAQLDSKEVLCKARDKWREPLPLGTLVSVKKKMADSLSKELPDTIKLKVGAQVMLTRNKDLDRSLVNGSRGVVIGFEGGESTTIPIVRFDCGVVTSIAPVETVRYNPDAGGAGCLVRSQVPLKLAWAITVHKSQGATLTRAMLDISSAFEFGQCYVALSRVRSLAGLWLIKPARLENIKASPQVLEFYRSKTKI